VLAASAALLFVPIGWRYNTPLWTSLLDLAHVPFFAALTIFLHAINPLGLVMPRQRLVGAALLALACAAATEIIQPLTGREESLVDFRNGCAGIVLAVLWMRGRFGAAVALGVVVLVVAGEKPWGELRATHWRSTNFPVLADFEEPQELRLYNYGETTPPPDAPFQWRRSTENVAHGRYALRVETNSPAAPSLVLRQDAADWSGYEALAFDVFNPNEPFKLAIGVNDDGPLTSARDRYHDFLPIARGWNHFRIPLDVIAHGPTTRPLNLHGITAFAWHVYPAGSGATYYLDYVRLERSPAAGSTPP
jgi:hypothetical protein